MRKQEIEAAKADFVKFCLQHNPRAKCHVCGWPAVQTDWRPHDGLSPYMREYLCELGHRFYTVGKRGET